MVVKIRKRASAHVTSASLLPESTTTHSLAHSRPMSEDAWILRLANELLSHIISYLRAFEIERLARTFNRRLTYVCLPHLQNRIAGARNRRLMMDSFEVKDYEVFVDTEISDLFHSWGLAETHAFSAPPMDTFANLDHFDLQGDLSWIYPTPSEELQTMFPSPIFTRNPPIATAEQMDGLVSAASKLGVSLPLSFRRFMVDEDLHNRFPYCGEGFTTSPFVKLDLQAHGVGYATTFLGRDKDDLTFYLFAGDQGRTGVISINHTWEDLQEIYTGGHEEPSCNRPALSTLELELGVITVPARLAPDTALCAFDFEEFLFQLYFLLWPSVAIEENLGASPFRPPIEQFLLQTYTEEGRAQCN
jgi:hypothetical protein